MLSLFFDPFDAAGVTLPIVLAHGNGKRQKQPETVSPEAIKFFESNVERITTGTARLLIRFADFLFMEFGWDGLVQNGASSLGILLMDLQANAADGIREQPIHANQVAVGQGAGDSSRFQFSLGQQGLGDIAEMLQGDEFGRHFE